MKDNVRKIAGNFLNLNVINMLGVVIPILTMPRLSGALGQAGYSVVLLASILFQFGTLIVDYSFNLSGAREIARLAEADARAAYYASVQYARYALLLAFSVGAALYLSFSEVGLTPAEYALYIAPGLIGHVWFAPWFHLGRSSLSEISYLMLISRVAYLAIVLIWVREAADLQTALAANSAPLFVFGGAALVLRRRAHALGWSRLALSRRPFRGGLALFIADFAPNLYNNFPALYLAYAVERHEFAVYAVAMRLINAATSVQQMLGRAMLPVLSVSREIELGKVMGVNIALAVVMCAAIWLWSDFTIHLLVGPGYELSATYLNVLATSLVFGAIVTAFSSGYYIPLGHDAQFRNLVLSCSILAALVGVALVLRWGMWGAVVLLVCARSLMAVSMGIHYKLARSHPVGESK